MREIAHIRATMLGRFALHEIESLYNHIKSFFVKEEM